MFRPSLNFVSGVMNAADYYGLDELKQACSGFIQCCVTVDTVCALLATAERYIQYKCTKYLVHKVILIRIYYTKINLNQYVSIVLILDRLKIIE